MMFVGVVIRFTFLDLKIYGNDEATTSIHVSGKTIGAYGKTMFDGRPRTGRELLAFQRPDPAHGIRDVIQSLRVEDPQHPPLYYMLERQWELWAGSSISARRVLSALFGAAAVLTAMWFGAELYSRRAGFISGALVAVSPFAIAYSQVAREYSLWLALTFASCALFVRALRHGGIATWVLYTLATIAGLYTDAIFLLVIVAHVVSAAVGMGRQPKIAIRFIACLFVMLVAYIPWITALAYGYMHGSVTNNTYLSALLTVKPFLLKWIFNVGTLFYDADYVYPKTALLIIPGLVTLALASATCLQRIAANRLLSVIFSLAAVTILALVLPDFIKHEQRSTASRYLIPLWVSCYAALGVGLAIASRAAQPLIRIAPLWFLILTSVTGLGSFAISSKHDTWWVDGSTSVIGSIARAVDTSNNPFVIYHATWGPGTQGPEIWDFSVVMLANIVAPTTRFIQFGRDQALTLPSVKERLLLLDPDDSTINAIRASGGTAVKVAGGNTASLSADIAALRQSVAAERKRQGITAILSAAPSLWAIHRLKNK